jgi:transposase-like protein
MTKRHRRHSTAKKRQVVEEYLNGETLHALSKRHDVCRTLIRVWIEKHERGEFDDDAVEADLLPEYEARIAALERLVGRQALEIEFLKGAQKNGRLQRSARTSVITGPTPSRSDGGAS